MQVRSRRHPVRIEPARVLLRFNVADVRRSLDVPQPILAQLEGIELDDGRAMFAKASEVTAIRPAPDPTPFSQAQLDAAGKTAAAAVKAAADRAAATYGA
jgi:hypothetical protein